MIADWLYILIEICQLYGLQIADLAVPQLCRHTRPEVEVQLLYQLVKTDIEVRSLESWILTNISYKKNKNWPIINVTMQ